MSLLSKQVLVSIFILGLYSICFGQGYQVAGQMHDAADNSSLPGVNVILSPVSDSTKWVGITTDMDGKFTLKVPVIGKYVLKASFIGYESFKQVITVSKDKTWLGALTMQISSQTLGDVVVEAQKEPVQQRGDTMLIDADEFKTDHNATTEDLVNKMPGVTLDNGVLKVNGETITKILVDGKPFFGDDPTVALKNLPADAVRKIQIYDQMSDQAKFTGFDDGNSERTINLITDKSLGYSQFGNFYGAGGTDDRYITGGDYNIFKGDQRISLIFLSNNINQQNFSGQDLAGLTKNGGSSNNFMVGQQGGIASTNAIGFNYSDNWGKKVTVTGSYFFNYTDDHSTTSLSRKYLGADSGQLYNELDTNHTQTYNHRINLRMEYTIDSFNSIIWTPRMSIVQNNNASSTNGTMLQNDSLENNTYNQNTWKNSAWYLNQNLLLQHKFKKAGRTISLNIANGGNDQNSTSTLISNTNSYQTLGDIASDSVVNLNQSTNQNLKGYWISANASYTEPVGKYGQIQVNYNPTFSKNILDKETYNLQPDTSFDTAQSNKFNENYITQRSGTAYRFNNEKINFMVGFNYQYATLSGLETFPTETQVDKSFSSYLPQMSFNYKFSRTRNLKVFYNVSSNAPNIWQLQNVVNNSNPLFLSSGNPNLKQDYEHGATLRYESNKPDNGASMSVYVNGNYYQNYMGTQTVIADSNTVLKSNDVALLKGSQFTMPVNLSGYWNTRAFFNYGKLISAIKCNFNLNTGVTYSQTPGQIIVANTSETNNTLVTANNNSDTYVFTEGLSLSSNISEKMDFTVSYRANYNIVNVSNSNYFSQSAYIRFNWVFWKGFVYNTTLNHNLYYGLSQSYDQDVFLWNMSLGYRFLKNQDLEVKAGVFDLLNDNSNINRAVNVSYIQDSRTDVLNRYFMLTVTYNLKKIRT